MRRRPLLRPCGPPQVVGRGSFADGPVKIRGTMSRILRWLRPRGERHRRGAPTPGGDTVKFLLSIYGDDETWTSLADDVQTFHDGREPNETGSVFGITLTARRAASGR